MPNPLIDKLLDCKRIAVVGISEDPFKPSNEIARYLMQAGYEVIPVNPNLKSVLDLTCYPTLNDIPDRVDLVNVFRRPEFIPSLVEQAIRIQAGGVWVQLGIRSPSASMLAKEAGLDYVEDCCILIEHSRRHRA